MAESHALFALKRRYGRTLGVLHVAHADRIRLMADLAHLAAVIRMFAPGEDVTAIKLIRPYRPNRSKWSRTALSILRVENGPITARALARRVLQARGVPLVRANLQRVECSLHAVLERLEGHGVIRADGSPKRWSVSA